MAAADPLQDLCEESTCSICLEYFQDPVTIECGHNFCRACLAKCWDNSGGEEISCPQCRGKVQRKLIPNRPLANFVELTRKLHIQEGKSPEGKGGVCGKHQEPLKLFCKDDIVLICVVCDKAKEHRNHNVVPLEEAAQDYQNLICSHLRFLEKERVKILAYKAETEEQSQELLKRTKAEMEKMKEQFRELRSLLNEKEKLLLTQLEEVEKETAKKRDEHLARISRELSSLGGLIREMEEKCQQLPGELLQDVRSVLQRKKAAPIVEFRCEKEETFQNLITFPSELNAKISEVSDRNNSLVGLMKQLKANVTLDPDTAHTSLTLSEDCKSVTCGDKLEDLLNSSWIALSEDHKSVTSGDKTQNLHDNPERFSECHYVLGREGFTGERLYWEVTVGSEGDWAVGVARKTLRRKGFFELSTEEGIWAIQKYDIWGGRSEYRASSYSVKAVLPPSGNVRRVRVSLSCKEGEVAFHDGDTGTHLYTFSGVSFSGETLLPFFTLQGKNNKKM